MDFAITPAGDTLTAKMRDRVFAPIAGLLLASLSLTLLALAAEVVLRWQDAKARERALERDPSRELCTEPDPVLVYRYAANRCGFNSRGYRDGEHDAAKLPGVLRFVVIGDSVAAGDGVAIEERFDRVLARRLAEAGVRVEIVNLARTGYSTSQELIVLEREGYAYHPDLVIWSYVLNDPADPVFHKANGRLGQYYVRPRWHVLHGLRKLLFKVRERAAGLRCPEEFHAFLHCAYADQVARHIERIGELAAEHATPTLVVIHPVFEPDRELADSSLAGLNRELAARMRSAGLEVLDLLPAYAPYACADLQQTGVGWFDPWHPNARGHAVAAQALAEKLREMGALIPRAEPQGSSTKPATAAVRASAVAAAASQACVSRAARSPRSSLRPWSAAPTKSSAAIPPSREWKLVIGVQSRSSATDTGPIAKPITTTATAGLAMRRWRARAPREGGCFAVRARRSARPTRSASRQSASEPTIHSGWT